MSRPANPHISLYANTVGNVADQTMLDRYHDQNYGGPGREFGGAVILGAGVTTADVTITDLDDKVIYSATGITAKTTVDSKGNGVRLPLKVTTANVAGGSLALLIVWTVRK